MTRLEMVDQPNLVAVLQAAESARFHCEQVLSLLASQRRTVSEDVLNSNLETQRIGVQNKRLLSQLAVIRGCNRRAILDVRRTKQDTAHARHEVDTLHLQLQNLYYEQRHLRGEIAGCENYDHAYQKLPLLGTSIFLGLFPDHSTLDEHNLMRLRIDHEHADRVSLEEARQVLLKRKQTLIAENNKRKEVIAALDKKMEDWMEGSEQVDEEFATCAKVMTKIGLRSDAQCSA